MLRSVFSTLINGKLAQIVPAQYQTLRWKRKPRKPFWLGTAKSKKFRIHEQPVLPPEEEKELLRLHANYKTALKSIRQYFESAEFKRMDAMEATAQLASAEVIEASLKRNEEWNAVSARMRSERLTKVDQEHEETVLQVMDRVEAKKASLLERIDDLVRIEKAKSKDFITAENLDAKIEECLATSTDYDYAIDLQGNIYTGFESEMKALSQDSDTPQAKQDAVAK